MGGREGGREGEREREREREVESSLGVDSSQIQNDSVPPAKPYSSSVCSF